MARIRTFLALLLLVGVCIGASAQGKGTAERMKYIRNAYSAAQQLIAMADEEPMTENRFTINISQMLPGSGPHKEVMEFFFTLDEPLDPESGTIWTNALYLVRHSFNFGARQYYNEYLFDWDLEHLGEPLFCLTTSLDTGETQRFYFDEKGKIIKSESAVFDTEDLFESEEHLRYSIDSAYSIFLSTIGENH